MAAFGFERLREQLDEHISAEWDGRVEDINAGDTPIEKLLLWALIVRVESRASEYREVVITSDSYAHRLMEEGIPRGAGVSEQTALIVVPQCRVGERIVDFMIHTLDTRPLWPKNWVWRGLIVECDGHDFHERTKEQAARDRAKDRAAVLAGADQFRFTGSEIWRDPWGCAEQITDWAARGR